MKKIQLGKKWIGENSPCFIIAEIGGLFKNFDEAQRLIDSAKTIGVDAIKFQTYDSETITTKKNFFNLSVTGKISQYEFFKQYQISEELQLEVVKYANECDLTIFTAPSHIKDLKLIEKMDLPFYKIGSDLACHTSLLKKIAKLGKPIILSSGMCTLDEVKQSVEAIFSVGNDQLALMHCVSDYPTKIEEVNLNAILTMKKEFGIPVGYSDHTVGSLSTLSAAIMGANLVEKHFKHDKNSISPDDIHSLNENEFNNLVKSIRNFELAKGTGEKIPTKSELENLKTNRVSIIANRNIPKNSIINEDMIDIRRPGTGISPVFYEKIIGKKTKILISKEEPIMWKYFY